MAARKVSLSFQDKAVFSHAVHNTVFPVNIMDVVKHTFFLLAEVEGKVSDTVNS